MRKKLVCIVGSLISVFSNAVAHADVRATFADPDRRGNMIVEVADSGEMRFTDPQGGYFLIVDGHAFSVQAGPGGPTVTSAEALAFLAREDIRTGRVIFSTSGDEKASKANLYEPEALVNTAGYEGTRYIIAGTQRPALVLTEKPELRPLGRAMATYFRMLADMSAEPVPELGNLYELLETHGILEFWGQKLVSASFAPIDRSRFAIPATPLTLDNLKLDSSEGESVSASNRSDRAPVIRAIFRDHALLTLTSDGKIHAWADGSSNVSNFDVPGKVRDFCKQGNEIILVTGDSQSTGIKIWSGTEHAWTLRISLKNAAENGYLALDCSGAEPILLTTSSMRFLATNREVQIRPDPILGRAYLTTLQHGQYLYVGANAGEWGGGLRRFSLKDGSTKALDGSDPQELCGGLLNTACAPVTGIVIDPSNPNCVLVATGLVHLMSSGMVVRVCGESFSLAYAKPYTIELGWKFNPKDAPSSPSVPFFSMGAGSNKAWAIAGDGLYTFAGNPLPTFAPFPRPSRLSASGIDWTNKDFVLISTTMNQVHSLSGSSLILVPR